MSLPPATDNYIGEPEYPSPWTTKRPKEGLRDNDAAIIVSLVPDVCKSPSVPVPYPIVDFCGHDENYTPTVRFTGQKAMVLRSNTTHVHGDEPGVGKGVKSGTVGDISEPIGHAPEVRAEGSPVIRHLDRFWMNRRNTQGEAIFVRDMKPYEAPKDEDPVPGSLVMSDASPEPLIMGAQYAQALPAPSPIPAPAPKPPGQVIRPNIPQWNRPPPTTAPKVGPWLRRLGKFGRFASGIGAAAAVLWPSPTAMPWYDEMPQDAFEESLFAKARELEKQGVDKDDINDWFQNERMENARRKAKEKTEESPKPAPLPQTETVRVDPKKCYIFTLAFSTPAKGTTAEMNRQLGFQQAALNSKNPCKAAKDIADNPKAKPIGESERPKARAKEISNRATLLQRLNPSLSAEHARTKAEQFAADKDAIHTLDMIAGGAPTVFSGLGGRSENRSIGSQWGKGGKAGQLEAYAQDQCRNGCPLMQTRLLAI